MGVLTLIRLAVVGCLHAHVAIMPACKISWSRYHQWWPECFYGEAKPSCSTWEAKSIMPPCGAWLSWNRARNQLCTVFLLKGVRQRVARTARVARLALRRQAGRHSVEPSTSLVDATSCANSAGSSPGAAMDNVRKAAGRMPSGNAVGGLARVLLLGGAAVWGASNSLFNVEGGHRAIVFNRLSGIKDTVRCSTWRVFQSCIAAEVQPRNHMVGDCLGP